jgi:flagellar basal body L-ring protein FlgH
MHKSLLTAGALALSLAACNPDNTAATTETPAATTPAEPVVAPALAGGVERAETAAPAAPATPALATQPGPKGTQAALTKARVTGDILTVELQYSLPMNSEDKYETVRAEIDQISYIDDATSRKYNVLKDQAGMYMALPLDYSKKSVAVDARKTSPGIMSLKFPAPPATSSTISLSVPGGGSFDGITIQR